MERHQATVQLDEETIQQIKGLLDGRKVEGGEDILLTIDAKCEGDVQIKWMVRNGEPPYIDTKAYHDGKTVTLSRDGTDIFGASMFFLGGEMYTLVLERSPEGVVPTGE